MITNFDTHIGFWLKSLPYIWVPGNTVEECKRFYLLHHNAAALFDENDNIIDRTFVIQKNETFSILPMAKKQCKLVRNCFLVDTNFILFNNYVINDYYNSFYKGMEVRIEGVELKIGGKVGHLADVINIIDPQTNYSQIWVSYGWRFGNYHNNPPYGINAPIQLVTQNKSRSFPNFLIAMEKMNVKNHNDFKRIHVEALEFAYANIMRQEDSITKSSNLSLIEVLIKDVFPKGKINPPKKFGWRYNIPTELSDAHNFYEISVGEKQIYDLKNVNKSTSNISKHLIPKISSTISLTKDSLTTAQKISQSKETNIEKILENFYNQKSSQPLWSTNKNPTKSKFADYINAINKNKKYNFRKNPEYVDIGSGSGEDAIFLAKDIGSKSPILSDVEDVRLENTRSALFVKIKVNTPLELFIGTPIQKESIDVVSMFHSLHHMIDAEFRLKNVANILKPGGFFLLKDHNVISEEDSKNVSFEHFVYSIGEGKATINDKKNYQNILPMYFFSADNVAEFLESLGFKKIFVNKYNNPTKTYQALFQKI